MKNRVYHTGTYWWQPSLVIYVSCRSQMHFQKCSALLHILSLLPEKHDLVYSPTGLTNNSLEWEISTHSCLKNVEAFSIVGRLSETQTDPWWLSWQFLGFRTTVLQKIIHKKKPHSDIYHSSENLEKSNNHQFFEDFEITRTAGSFLRFWFLSKYWNPEAVLYFWNNLKDQNRRLLAESNAHPTQVFSLAKTIFCL